MKKNILVFPCGSEIALELYRSLKHSAHFRLIGASSVADHGKFVFENYIEGIPFIEEENFLSEIKKVVNQHKIDAIYPAMDKVIEILKSNEEFLECKVVAPASKTTQICLSKTQSYATLKGVVKVPQLFLSHEAVKEFPVFTKPDIGYGSRGAKKCNTLDELKLQLQNRPDSIICEYLPGEEYTVDCFTDQKGSLLYAASRKRARIMNGISVNTKPVTENLKEFENFAKAINEKIQFNGAWFFQVKRDRENELTLLEVASRFGGSSALFRAKGVNFALLSLFNTFDYPLSIIENDYFVEMDRALDNKYKIELTYDEIFVDFDDCLYLEKQFLNTDLIALLYKGVNQGKRITLLTKHDDQKLEKLDLLLDRLRIRAIFDRIIHIDPRDKKEQYIDNLHSIFIDDSFAERKAISEKWGIPVFSLDMIEVL